MNHKNEATFQMGYKDELIRRLQEDGGWETLSDEEKRSYENMTDDQAGAIMATLDSAPFWDEKDHARLGTAVAKLIVSAFKGSLVEQEGENIGKLSRAGTLLAEFLLELEKRGIPVHEASAEFKNPCLPIGLLAGYKLGNEGPL